MSAGNLVIQHPHDAAAIVRAGQFVEFGEFFDALVGLVEFDAASVQLLAQRVAVETDECALSDGENEAQRRGEALGRRRDRHADRNLGEQEYRRHRHCGERPCNRCLKRRHPQRGDAENKKQHVEKSITDFGRGQQRPDLDHDMAGDLINREIVIFETIVDMGFGQDSKDPDQENPGQKECRRDQHRDRAGMGVDQQGGRTEPVTDDLHRKGMPSMRQAPLHDIQREAVGERNCAAGSLTLKQ